MVHSPTLWRGEYCASGHELCKVACGESEVVQRVERAGHLSTSDVVFILNNMLSGHFDPIHSMIREKSEQLPGRTDRYIGKI